MTEDVNVVRIDTQPAQVSLADLRRQLKELKSTLLSTEEGTEEYNNALRESAKIQHNMAETTRIIKQSSNDVGTVFSNLANTMGGVVAGFQAAKATMTLFGIENEAVLESLQKMQSLMAMTQALPAIHKAADGFRGLRDGIAAATGATNKFGKALISTGLGAIIAVLGIVIANFETISGWIDDITGESNYLGKTWEKIMNFLAEAGAKTIGGLYSGFTTTIETIKAVGKAIINYITTPFKAVWNAIEAYTSTEGGFGAKLKAAGKAMADGVKNDFNNTVDDFKNIGVKSAEAYEKGYQLASGAISKWRESKVKKKGKKKGTARGKAEETEYQKAEKEIANRQRAEMIALQSLSLSYEEYTKRKEEIDDKYNKERIAKIKQLLEDTSKLSEEEVKKLEEDLIKLQDSTYKKPEDKKDGKTKEDKSKSEMELMNDSLSEFAKTLDDVSNNPAWGDIAEKVGQIALIFDDLNKKQKEFGEGSVKAQQYATTAYMAMASVGLSAMASMFDGIAKEQDTNNKKGFETAKKMQIASATMTTLSSILQALAAGNSMASQLGLAAPVGWAMGAAMATMVGALGAVNIGKIAKQQFGQKQSVGSSVSTPSSSAVSNIVAPVQYTKDVQGAEIEGAIKNQKVYVTESDITNTQKKVDVTESEAMF